MGKWNYRIVRKGNDFAIYEVYYNDNGKPFAFTDEPCRPWGESLDELKTDMKYFQEALSAPVLDSQDLEKQCKKNEPKELKALRQRLERDRK